MSSHDKWCRNSPVAAPNAHCHRRGFSDPGGDLSSWPALNSGASGPSKACARRAAETLSVQTEALTRILDKYRLLPPLLSREASIVSLFDAGGHASDAARSKAIDIHGMSGAKEVVLFYPDGRILAAARGFFGDRGAGSGRIASKQPAKGAWARAGDSLAIWPARLRVFLRHLARRKVARHRGRPMSTSIQWKKPGRFRPTRFS